MEDSVAIRINDEVDGVRKKFEAEFNFRKVETTIFRFPAGLRDMFKSTRYPYIAPKFVAIGPYHHPGEKQLKKMEEVKKAAAYYLCELMDLEPNEAMKRMEASEALKEARGKYVDHIVDDKEASFAAMMFYDASFLLLYMVAYTNSQGKKENYYVNPSMRRFLFSNRDSINNDIMLLENQLPWPVLQALMGLVSEEDKKREYLFTAVGKFIAGIGNEFKVSVDFHTECYVWDDEKNPPPHLLALLRRHMTERQQGPERLNKPLPLLSNCFKFDKEKTMAPNDETPQTKSDNQQEKNYKFTLMPTVSPMELEEIGIKLKGSQTATFSDMDFVPGRLWSELSLVPLSLSNTRASCLVNMVAFELCTASRFGDGHDRTAVCSYLALLAMLMVREEDVRTLRSKGLLHGHQSDNQVLTFFKTVAIHLPDTVSRFAIVMENIDEYRCRRRVWISLYKWLYNHYASILQVASILKVAALLGTLITIYTAVRSLHKQG